MAVKSQFKENDQIPWRYKLLKLNQEETDNLNSHISSKETEFEV